MRLKATIITITIVALLAGTAVGVWYWIDRHYAQPYRDLSKMMAVRIAVEPALSAYYEKNRSYPPKLSDLPLQSLRWGDEGCSQRDLESWKYTSDGQSFEMVWEGPRNLKVFLGGSRGRSSFSKDEQR